MGDTGNSIASSIGHFSEELLESSLRGITLRRRARHPDFEGDGFWLESKVGTRKYGPHVHDFQWWYDGIAEPVVYAFGYHNLDDVNKRMRHLKTDHGRRRYLERNMQLESVYFVSFDVVKLLHDKQKGKGAGKNEFDFVVGPSIPRNVVSGRTFNRRGTVVTAPDYYGYDASAFVARDLAPVGGLPFSCGYFVDKSHDAVLGFLKKNRI